MEGSSWFSSKRNRVSIDHMVNYFEYVEFKNARYNRLIAKFKPHHQVTDWLDLKKLLELHKKFDLRETYNNSFYVWHRESVQDVKRKMAVIKIRDHVRLLFINKDLARCLMNAIDLPLEILKVIAEFLPNRVLAKFLVMMYKANV